jgi:catechol 2,3-dioxygenase-like lactoylglutathione lyase family enzyme
VSAADVSTRIPAQDLERARTFYRDKLGLTPLDPDKFMLAYCTQRASEGGLIIYEATAISGRGWLGAPGMFR